MDDHHFFYVFLWMVASLLKTKIPLKKNIDSQYYQKKKTN